MPHKSAANHESKIKRSIDGLIAELGHDRVTEIAEAAVICWEEFPDLEWESKEFQEHLNEILVRRGTDRARLKAAMDNHAAQKRQRKIVSIA